MRYICTNKCDVGYFGNCVVTESEMKSPAFCNAENRCSAGKIPKWTVFDEMGEEGEEGKAKRSENFTWFVQNHEQLYLIHGTCYLVIVDKAVVHTAKSFSDAYAWVLERNIPFFNIQYNNGTPSGYTAQIITPFWSFVDVDDEKEYRDRLEARKD